MQISQWFFAGLKQILFGLKTSYVRHRSLYCVAALLLATGVSSFQALKGVVGAIRFMQEDRKSSVIVKYDADAMEERRELQKKILASGVYIPLEDIIIRTEENSSSQLLANLILACGPGRVFVWMPLQFKFPIIGEKVFEWCLVKA